MARFRMTPDDLEEATLIAELLQERINRDMPELIKQGIGVLHKRAGQVAKWNELVEDLKADKTNATNPAPHVTDETANTAKAATSEPAATKTKGGDKR